AIPPSRSAACKRCASGNARRRAGWPFRPTRGAGPRRRRALSPQEQSFRIDFASQRKGARRREWQRQRDVSSSPEANWELRLQQSPNKRELILYVNHQQRFEADATLTHVDVRKSLREARSRTLTFLCAGLIAQGIM